MPETKLYEYLKKQQFAVFKLGNLPTEPINKAFSVTCTVSKNRMSASLCVKTQNLDCGVSELDLLKSLMDNGICVGVDYRTIEEIVKKYWFNKDIRIATGFLPQDGEDAQLIPLLELHELMNLEKVSKSSPGVPVNLDQEIMRKEPATPGVPGFNVLGEPLEAKPGSDKKFEYGKNIDVSQDGLSLVATIPGRAVLVDGKPSVVERDYGEWKFDIKLRFENMEAVVVITPGMVEKPDISSKMVGDLLSKNNVVYGIEQRLASLIPPHISMTTLIKVAEGKAPTQGKSASIRELFKKGADAEAKLFKVKEKELIVEQIPAEQGKPGKNVLGEDIPPEEIKDIELKAGINTKSSNDGNKLYAAIDGYISHTKDGYGVVPVRDFDLSRDVLPQRVDFDGMVRIRGDVTNGHSVIAGSHIVITGNVVSSDIISGGILKVHGKISECGSNRIQAAGDMHLGPVESARMRSSGNIILLGNVRNSETVANEISIGDQNRNITVAGGRIVSTGSIEVGIIGDGTGVLTRIESGMPFQIRTRYEQTLRAIRDLNNKSNAAVREIKRLTGLAKIGKLQKNDYDKIKKLRLYHQINQEKQRQLKGYLSKALPVIMRQTAAAAVTAWECAFPGSVLTVGVHSHSIKEKINGAIFRIAGNSKSLSIQPVKKSIRKKVTIVFTDIVSYSTYTSKFGDSAANAMVTTHNDMLFPVVSEFNGRIIKTIGDAIMAVFNSADSAVGAAVKMQKVLDNYNRNQQKEHQIKVRIGMNTGIGTMEDNDVFGDVVNMASRVEGLSGGDEIFISAATFESLQSRDHIRIFSLGMKKLKGKEEPVEVLSVDWK